MPSKGVLCFSYVAVDGIEIQFDVPKQSAKKTDQYQFGFDHLEVDASNLGLLKIVGRFQFVVRRDGRELTKQWVDVNVLTGKLVAGTMVNMEQTPAVLTEDLIIVYGLYEAGPGLAGLPNQHECYVTVTRNYEDWMRDVIPQDGDKSNRPFSRMILPSAHDIGMNSMQTCMSLLKHAGTGLLKDLFGRSIPFVSDIFNRIGDGAINQIAPNIIRALAITQKDSLDTILKIGARYFEFRPAKCHRQLQAVSDLEDTWYFQHGAIPGMPYKQFLSTVIQFLADHENEIIVVHLRWDGVPAECPRPTPSDLLDVLNPLLEGRNLQLGSQEDMQRLSIRDLRSTQKRFIMLQNAAQISNYDDTANATLTGDSMVSRLNSMADNPPSEYSLLLLQCQATATNIRDVVVASVLDSDVSTSPLLATKPVCDRKILPVIRGDAGKKIMGEDGMVVVMNDFFDGGTAKVAIEMCGERLG